MTLEPLLFIPGLGATEELFAPQLEAFRGSRLCVVAKHGRFPDIRTDAFSVLAQAPARFALVGHSMGGYLAFDIMRQAPDRVTRLALLSTRVTPDTGEDRERRVALIGKAEEGKADEIHAALWPRLVSPEHVDDKGLEALVLRMLNDTGAEKFIIQQRAMMNRMHFQMTLESIRVPTLVMVGSDDVITPQNHSRHMAMTVPESTLVIIPRAGHLVTLEQPYGVNNALEHWLARPLKRKATPRSRKKKQ